MLNVSNYLCLDVLLPGICLHQYTIYNPQFVNIQIQPGAKSEALDNIYSLFKQNIKSCNAKRRRQRRRTVKNNNRSNQQKSNFARAAHFFCTFLCRCFARLQRETSRNVLVTRFMEEMSYVFPFTFFHCRSFSPFIGGRQHFPFCHRHYTKFPCCSSDKKMSSSVFHLAL